MGGRRRVGRVRGLLVDECSSTLLGLGKSMNGGYGAVRSEGVCASKRRSSPAAKARAQNGKQTFRYLVLQIRGSIGFLLRYLGWYDRATCVEARYEREVVHRRP